MRKLTGILLLSTIAFILFLLINGIIKKSSYRAESDNIISALPKFRFMTLTESWFSSDSLVCGPVLIVYYNPECDHCLYEITELAKCRIHLDGIKLLLVTNAKRDKAIRFLEPLDLLGDRDVLPLLDTDNSFYRIFGSASIPSSYIYDEELKLVRAFYGEYKVETLLKYLTGSEKS